MKTEKEKMLSNELYNHKDAELTKERNHAYELTLRYNQTKDDETELRTSILQQLAGKLGNNVVIKPPFQCDYGYNLILGDNVFMNYGCSILDCNVVEIGNNVLMAPNVQIYAAYHPTDHTLRLKDLEYADRVKIGDNTWIGGGSIILNGVTIGKNTVIGAGSVVTKDIPDNVVAVGNPCRVIKRLDKENVENGKRLKFTDFAHINIVVDDIDEGIKYYEQLLEAKPIQIFREFSNIGFAKAAGFLEHPELVKLSIAFMEIPGTKLTLELMEYYEPVTTDAKHREDVNKINGVRHVPHAEGVLDMYGNNSYVELPVSEVAAGVRNTTYAEVYKELWPEGIVCALNDFARAITENSQKNIMAQQMLTISEIWKDLSEKIGSPQLIVTPERNGIRLADIAE